MTGEVDELRMLDAITKLNYPRYNQAKTKLEQSGRLNQGTQKALDSFYGRVTSKTGIIAEYNFSTGQIIVRNPNGQIRKKKGLRKLIKRLKEQVK